MINPFESIVERLDMLDKKLDQVKSMVDTKSPEHEKDSPLTINEASTYLQLKKNTIYYMTSRKIFVDDLYYFDGLFADAESVAIYLSVC